MRKLTIYTNGARVIAEHNTSAAIHGGIVQSETDLSNADDEEFKILSTNPHDDTLIDKIKKRAKDNKL